MQGYRRGVTLLVLSAMFIAIIFISIFFFSIPNGFGGFIHFGDSLIFIAGALLPFPYNIIVAALGPGLFNLARAPIWFPFTIVIKPFMALCFTREGETILFSGIRNRIAPFLAVGINTVLYFFANMILFGGWAGGVAALPGLLIQGGGSIIFFFLIAGALDGIKAKKMLGLWK